MKTKRKPIDLRAEINKCIEGIQWHRDELRKLLETAKEAHDAADESLRSLEDAIDKLSETM